MITLIGDGGHAAVIRDLINLRKRIDKTFADTEGTIIAVGNNRDRAREVAERKGTRFTYLIHPTASFSSSALIGMGTVVMAGAVVQARAIIGNHCIINTGATVDHDCNIEDFVHIAPGANLCGGVRVGEGSIIGVGVGIEPGVVIPKWSIVKRTPYGVTISSHATA